MILFGPLRLAVSLPETPVIISLPLIENKEKVSYFLKLISKKLTREVIGNFALVVILFAFIILIRTGLS